MKIHSSDIALYGQNIDVRGTIYTIAKDGSIADVTAEHAAVLLQFRGYRVLEADPGQSIPGADDAPPVDRWAARLAELEGMSGRRLMALGRMLGLKMGGKTSSELARDILECEKRSEDSGDEPAES